MPAALVQLGHHITVAHIGPHKGDIALTQGQLQPEIGHQGSRYATFEYAALIQIERHDIQQLVAIHFVAVGINHHDPVAIPIKGDTQVCLLFYHSLAELPETGGTHTVIDIQSVGADPYGNDGGAQLLEYAWRHF